METEEYEDEGQDAIIRKQRGKLDLAIAELAKRVNGQANPVSVSFVCPICQGEHSKKDHVKA